MPRARPGALPHLSHALVETWLRREGATLTVAGYEASGGISGAIAQSADRLYQSMDADQRVTCRRVLPSTDGARTRWQPGPPAGVVEAAAERMPRATRCSRCSPRRGS